ncbi:MAG: branched-chain amino acid ABC transporter permease [Chloroflexi bacterium]|nr:branched-chain amino acid ABC transporter permease [Chloroflexota bacterium]
MKLSTIALFLVGIAAMLVLPVLLSSYYVGLLILVLIYAIFAMSLDILQGYGGLPSLGHAAFFGVASYTSGYLALKILDNFWLEFVAGLGLSMAVAAVFGLLALRTRGVYFLMITLALSQVLWGIAFKWTSVTRGDDGLSGIPRPDLVLIRLDLTDTSVFYYFTLVFFLIATVAMFLLVRSPFGLALQGIRDSETRMRALGYNVWLYQYVAFLAAGFFAAIAGSLFVYYNGYVGPGYLNVVNSAKVMLMVIMGGAGSLVGPIIGAASIVLMENIISGYTERWLLILGFIYVLVIVFAPQGVYNPIKRKVRAWLSPQAG